MPDTPTVEGSIVAYLRLNDDDWKAKLDAAEQKARDLGAISPTITVHADVADAIAKLEAAELAAERVGGSRDLSVTTTLRTDDQTGGSNWRAVLDAATKASQDASAASAQAGAQSADDLAAAERRAGDATLTASRFADMANRQRERLNTMREAGTMSDERLATAEGSLAQSVRAAANAAKVAAAAQADLNRVRRAAESTTEGGLTTSAGGGSGAAKDAESAAASGGNNGGYQGYWQTIAVVVAAMVPVMSQLAGYIAGVGGAFMGMGVAGVLAVKGVEAEMAAGTAQGQAFGDSVGLLKGDLRGLEDAAASGVLTPFQDAVGSINGAMPQLSSEIQGFGSDLGELGATVVNTLITGFEILNPLFQEGAGYLQHLASEWQAWVSGGGLSEFAQDAERALPLVGSTLEQLVSLAVKVVAAFAPMGTLVLSVIDGVATVLNLIPLNVLTDLAVGATAAFTAFKAWGILAPLMSGVADALGAVGVAADITAGPVGWIIAGIGAAAAAVMAFTSSTQQSTQAEQSYAQALEQSKGAIDENVRAQVAQQLATSGALEIARGYGIQLSTLTDAVLHHGSALDTVNAKIKENGAVMTQAHGVHGVGIRDYQGLTEGAQKLSDIVNGQNKSFAAAVQEARDYTAAMQSSSSAQTQAAQLAQRMTDVMNAETTASTNLTNEFKFLDTTGLSVAQGQTSTQAALNSVTDALKQNGTAVLGNTENAVANQQAIQAVVTASEASAEAIAASTGSTEKGTQAYAASKQALEDELQAQGALTPAVQAYINQIMQVPTERALTFSVDDAEAVIQLQNLIGLIDAAAGAMKIGGGTGMAGYYGFANGGPVGYANGGPVYAANGYWAPQGTDTIPAMLSPREYVVSNGMGQASRWNQLLVDVNRNASGLQVASTAMRLAGVGAQQGGTTVVNNYYTFQVTSDDPEIVAQYVAQKTQMRGAV